MEDPHGRPLPQLNRGSAEVQPRAQLRGRLRYGRPADRDVALALVLRAVLERVEVDLGRRAHLADVEQRLGAEAGGWAAGGVRAASYGR